MYLPREQGQALSEYSLVLMLVAIIVVAILTTLGQQIQALYTQLTGILP